MTPLLFLPLFRSGGESRSLFRSVRVNLFLRGRDFPRKEKEEEYVKKEGRNSTGNRVAAGREESERKNDDDQ